jgi:ABC-type polysaccharide/polyol phosphate transport system ATPase subunit
MNLHTGFNHQDAQTMIEPVIGLNDVSVLYRVPQERIPSLKEYVIRRLKRELQYQEFLALKGVDLKVYSGEVVGIIGPNGAGKSTLLKVVARVLRPTQGRVRTRGRISPLLDLGAGFDPELTGRENIYLNSMILGFSRQQINERFENIVLFSGLEEFIDAPLRTYSTGMVARLGFAVATDVRPDILIVDEILSVGDADFQLRSAERIQSFQRSGTTILLVSHSLDNIQQMCSRVVWLDQGHLKAEGDPEQVIHYYLEFVEERESQRISIQQGNSYKEQGELSHRWGSGVVEISNIQITSPDGSSKVSFQTGDSIHFHIDYIAYEAVKAPLFGIAIHRNDGIYITSPNTAQAGLKLPTIEGRGRITYIIPSLSLLEGKYLFSAAVVNQDNTEIYDFHNQLYSFRVQNHDSPTIEKYGFMTLNGEWKVATDLFSNNLQQ